MFEIISPEDYTNSILANVKNLIECPIKDCKKWKLSSNQLVLQAPDCYYKIYMNGKSNTDYFHIETRRCIANVYNRLGVKWELFEFENEQGFLQIEKREPVEVCSEQNIGSIENMFKKYNETLKLIENEMGLKYVSYTVKQTIHDLYTIKLVRDCICKYIDYGITKDGNVILLDDNDFYLAIANKNGDSILYPATCFEVSIKDKTKWFMQIEDINNICKANEIYTKWILNSNPINKSKSNLYMMLKNDREKALADNLKFLATEKYDEISLAYDGEDDVLNNLAFDWKAIEKK